ISGAAQEHPETPDNGRIPLLIAHFIAAWIEPHHIYDVTAAHPSAPKEFRTPKDGMGAAKLDQLSCKLEKLILFFVALPIEPADLVVLAIGVIVPLLGSAELIAAQT